MAKKTKKGRKVSVDFSKVKEGGGGLRLKEGNYRARIKRVELTDSQAGDSMLVFHFEFPGESKAKGKVLKDRIVLKETVLWRLRNLLVALGKKVPKKAVNLNIDDLTGEELGLQLIDGDYKGRIRSEVADYLTLEDLEDEDDDDDEDEDEDDDDNEDDNEDEDEDDDDDEDLDEIDVDEL